MAKTSTARDVGQEGSLREGLETAIRERVQEIIEMVLQEEVEAALGAGRSQRVAERAGYRHGWKQRRLTLRTGTIGLHVPRARLGAELRWKNARRAQLSTCSAGPRVKAAAASSGRILAPGATARGPKP